jgi:spore maturation protein CgeB
MKLLKITRLYKDYIRVFYRKNPDLSSSSYDEQKKTLDYDAFGWSDYWLHALSPLGYEVMEVNVNVEPLQRAWARENYLPNSSSVNLAEIAFEQARKFEPEVIWFEDGPEELLKRIRSEIPSIRLVLGWVGSAIPRTDIWRQMDLVLSCAQESVGLLQNAGHSAAQLHHGFDPRINTRLKAGQKNIDFSFIGQLIRSDQFHRHRDKLLEKIASETKITIFSPSGNYGWWEAGTAILMSTCYDVAKILKFIGFPDSILRRLPVIGNASQWQSRPVLPVNPGLKPFIRPPVFGLDMFQILMDSKVNLNIHADSSPDYASNMRLFETTGVGTCLITDWKINLHQLFEIDKEVIAYKSAEECAEKVRWLLDHPKTREEIGLAGQKRTIKDHTYSQRAVQLHNFIVNKLGQ